MFQGKNIFNASFNVYADNYHSVRPGYPESLFKDIQIHGDLSKKSRLLEIGAGSGIATVKLAEIAGKVVAIEPGVHLADIAREQTRSLKNVEVLTGTFEDFETTDKFDTLLAFTAFHWLKEEEKYQKVFDLLSDSGSLVLVWNSFFQSSSKVATEVNHAYHEFLPDAYPQKSTVDSINEGVLAKLNKREQEMVQNPMFYTVYLQKYLTTYNYDSQTYPKLLNTYPKIVEIEEVRRMQFFSHISKIIEQHGGKISVPVLTTLIIAKKRDFFLKMISEERV
jgi:protein-L-isoaspartate O-methyltransferase